MSSPRSIRVGRVTMYLRGRVWYLRYLENGKRIQPRVGPDKEAARRLAAQVNAQVEIGAPSCMGFEPISLPDLRGRWLDYHEHVRRSSVATIDRYRAATDHLLRFVQQVRPVKLVSHFTVGDAELFARHLRDLHVAPNGHEKARKRRLRDKGVRLILEMARTLFQFALKRRHLSPYAENPFVQLEIDRIPIEDAKPVVLLEPAQEKALLEAADDRSFAIFLTLMLTGMRPGELIHLLLPDDVDLPPASPPEAGCLHIRNKPELGWQTKTRNQRAIPIPPELVEVLRRMIGKRSAGPVFLSHLVRPKQPAKLPGVDHQGLVEELTRRIETKEQELKQPVTRHQKAAIARKLWRDAGAVNPDHIRVAFMELTQHIGLPGVTTPKTLRHMFATMLQDANVDPLIRNRLMGHSAAGASGGGLASGGLGMTGVYTHCQPETIRAQLMKALEIRPALAVARQRLKLPPREVSGGGS